MANMNNIKNDEESDYDKIQEVQCSCCGKGFPMFISKEDFEKVETINGGQTFTGVCENCQLKKFKKSKLAIFIILGISVVICLLDLFNGMFDFLPILRMFAPIIMLINVCILSVIMHMWSKIKPKLNYKKGAISDNN